MFMLIYGRYSVRNSLQNIVIMQLDAFIFCSIYSNIIKNCVIMSKDEKERDVFDINHQQVKSSSWLGFKLLTQQSQADAVDQSVVVG